MPSLHPIPQKRIIPIRIQPYLAHDNQINLIISVM